MLIVDCRSAFNTIVPMMLITMLRTLGLNTSLSKWSLDFLMGRPQVVRVGNNTSATLILKIGAPQGWVHSPHLYSLFTHDCVAKHDFTIIKFVNYTKVITNNNETAYRENVRNLAMWCQDNNLSRYLLYSGAFDK